MGKVSFQGINALSLDAKGRLAIPSGYREQIAAVCGNALVLTLSPYDPCLWLYPVTEWEAIDVKLQQLSDFDKQSRRTKQMMRGYASSCVLDAQGRIRIPESLREFANLVKYITFLGQGNRFELWDADAWVGQRDEWRSDIGRGVGTASEALRDLAL